MPNYLGFNKLIEHIDGAPSPVAAAQAAADAARASANAAQASAKAAKTAALSAQEVADKAAATKSATALSANTAQAAAEAAQGATDIAVPRKAVADYIAAQSAQIAARTAANAAQTAADTAQTAADTAAEAATDADTAAEAAQTAADTAAGLTEGTPEHGDALKAVQDAAKTAQDAATKAQEAAKTAQKAAPALVAITDAAPPSPYSPGSAPGSGVTSSPALNKILNTSKSIKDKLNELIPEITDQLNSNIIQISGLIKSTIEEYYRKINPDFQVQIPLFVTNTESNRSGNQQLDVAQFVNNKGQMNIIIGLAEGKTLELIDSTNNSVNFKIRRQGDKISVNNGPLQSYNYSILIGNNRYVYSAAGSPIVFKVIYVGPTNPVAPVTLFDYLFMYSYFIGFIGAILYSIGSLITIDLTSIIMNRSISLAMNIYISICGFISICTWFNLDINNIISYNLFNQDVVIPIFTPVKI